MLHLSRRLGHTPVRNHVLRFVATILAAILLSSGLAPSALSIARTATASPAADAPTHWPDWSAYGATNNAELGYGLASIGDLNGDGHGDVLIGSPGYTGALTEQGRALVYYGSAAGLESTPSWTAEGGGADALFGAAVASAGDINGDGTDDVIVGEPRFERNGDAVGRVHVFVSTPSGLGSTPAWTVEGTQDGAYFGDAVAGVLDVNGDTYDDVLVGAPWHSTVDSGEGCAFLYFGTATGLSSSPGWERCGTTLDDHFGWSVGSAGDVNGDLAPDFIIGAPDAHGDQGRVGAAYVFHGASPAPLTTPAWTAQADQDGAEFGATVASVGDVNGDTYDDVLVAALWYEATFEGEGRVFVFAGSENGLLIEPLWMADGGQSYAQLGDSAAFGWDDDTYSDVIVSAPGHSGDKMADGRVYVFPGSGQGPATDPSWVAVGTQSGASFGNAVAAADLDDDGLSDWIVGSPDHSTGSRWSGATFAYLAGRPPRTPLIVNSSADDVDAEDVIRGDGDCMDALNRCTLRAAIQESNSLIGPDVITFDDAMVITVSAVMGAMPTVIDPLEIDGSSVWSDAGDSPGVVLVGGGGPFDGLRLHADGSSVFGLGITDFYGTGIVVSAANCALGGPSQGQRNVIASNVNEGITILGDGAHHNVVQSNYIGTAADGISESPNNTGVWISSGASENFVGGNELARRNVISGNTGEGLSIQGDRTDGNVVIGNYIGLAADGFTAAGNARGIDVSNASYTLIGWSTGLGNGLAAATAADTERVSKPLRRHRSRLSSQRYPWRRPWQPYDGTASLSARISDGPLGVSNYIVGNDWEGVRFSGDIVDSQLAGNVIRDNGVAGVVVEGPKDCLIEQNTIAGNEGPGVLVAGATTQRITISANSISDNVGKGIELAGGANGGIVPPSIIDADATRVMGIACSLCEVQIFSDTENEGAIPETSTEADIDGNWMVAADFSGPLITATNTRQQDGTSEFSSPWTIQAPPTATATTSATATVTATATATVTATLSASATATNTATPTASSQPSATPTPSIMPSPGSSGTPTPTPTLSQDTPTPEASATVTHAASATVTSDATRQPSATPTSTTGGNWIYMPIVRKLAPR